MTKFVPTVAHFFHKESWTCTFVAYDPATKDAVIIDSVMDLDVVNWQTSLTHNQLVIDFVQTNGLKVHYILDTHVHADHITGAAHLSKVLGATYAIGARIVEVQKAFAGLFGLPDFKCDGSQFGKMLKDNEVINAGSMAITCWNTPGHTPACMTYLIGDSAFTGDAIFTEDFGTGRCDFPGGSASQLYDSVMRVYTLPPATRLFVGHDYQPNGRELRVSTTVQLCMDKQEDLPMGLEKAKFVEGKEGYDKTLNLPKMIFPSLRVNMNAGVLPPAGPNGLRYFLIPMNTKQPTDEFSVKA